MKAARAGRRSKGKRRGKSPQPISSALEQFAKDLGISRPLSQYSVLTSWQEIVGEQIARVTKAERIEDGVLLVRVSTAPWRAELSLRRGEILEKLNAVAGRGIVREIRFR